MEENINDFLGIADSSIQSIKNLNAELDLTITKLGTLAEQAETLNKNLQAAGIKEVTKSMEDLNIVTDKINKTNSERLNIEREIKVEGQKATKIIMSEVDAWKQVDKVLQETTISFGELSQQLVDQQYKLDRNKAKQKELRDEIKGANTDLKNGKITRDEYTTILDRNNEKLADLTISEARYRAELSKSKVDLKVLVNEQKSAEGSMDQMNARLGYLRDTYRKLSQAERENADVGGELLISINELDDAMKMLDKSTGNNQRNVGNYEVAGKSLRMQLREIVQGLAEQKMKMDENKSAIVQQESVVKKLANTVGTNSDEYKQAKIQLDSMKMGLQQATAAMSEMERKGGEIKDAMDDANVSIQNMANDAGNTAAMSQGVGVLADSFQIAQAGMVAMGMEGEDMMKIYAKMMILQQGFNSLTQITNALQSESVLRLKLKAIWEKAALVFTQKKTSATIAETAAETTNVAATTAGAAATAGLAAAETVATKTSWTLAGSIKAVGAAIKSIPVIGWILAAVAALGTLTVLLYKHLAAEKELTAEQMQRKKVSEQLTSINEKVNESTLENVTRAKMLQNELGKVTKGSKEYQSIVKEINTLTGSQFDTIKATPEEIAKGTDEWVKQYKIRAKAEATIQKMVENELEFMKLKNEVQFASASDREESIDKLLLTPDQKQSLLKSLNLMKSNTTAFIKQNESAKVQEYLRIAETNMNNINAGLEKQITLEGLITDEKEKQIKPKVEKNNDIKNQSEIEIALIELRLTGIEKEIALRESKINTLKKERAEAEKIAIKEGKSAKEIYEINKGFNIKIEKERKDSNDKIVQLEIAKTELIKKNNEILVNTLNELEEIRLNNSTISENELTDRLITLEKNRANEIIKQNNLAKDKEIEGLEIGSEQYLSVVNKYEALNQLALEKSILRQAQIRKDGYTKTVAEIKRQIELSKAGAIIQQGGALSPDQESQFAISGVQSQISALDTQASTMDPLTQEYRDYVDQRKLLEADLTLETEKQSQLRIEQMKNERNQQLELTGAIGAAVFTLGEALSQNIKDEKQRVIIQQSLAVAQVLFNQAIAISQAIASATKGDPYTVALRIAVAVGSVIAAISQASQAISQANASVSSANAYAEGTSYHTGGAAIVGEGGQPELVKAGGRAFVVDQPTYFKDFPVGAQVIPFDKMTNEQMDMSETNELLKQIAGKQQVNINFGRTTNSQLIKGITRTTILNRRFKA